ncbi:hypothetical protein E4K67_02900 [Desulfosporosinus fructosivorans]|uniref:Uncharacterized protein n=1 Tax=Desulfosporosinus fructosivorans TaxID=2018669 RepID=A0A4Z0RBV8_9FIRM|nr:hypothetical protein [Desulfosporosinus fructosivorans]TGE39944.1 hypothetical protein E4K67_02900 [Desulfosporosinus fructosivorans]
MNKEDYLKLDTDSAYKFLSSELAEGKEFSQLLESIGMSKVELEKKQGFYYIKGKIMRKPFKGYATPKVEEKFQGLQREK